MNPMFQYPLRVLGCEKFVTPISWGTPVEFQYPLRVLGCEKVGVGVGVSV